MSSFYRVAGGRPYVPGEQPQDKQYCKLNTNECPYPPSPLVAQAIGDCSDLRLYPDPTSLNLRAAMATAYGLSPKQVFAGGGSDEVLAYCFMAFCRAGDTVVFPDITYGFYQVYADLFGLQTQIVPLHDDFTVPTDALMQTEGHIFLANPNAPTGLVLPPADIAKLLEHNPHRLVIVDEAYIDFLTENTCIPLLKRYENLIVVQTFSKSRALAGMRLGFGFASSDIIEDIEKVQFSFNPYNIDRLSQRVGIAAIQDTAYLAQTVAKVTATRERVTSALRALGFEVLTSAANFVFAAPPHRDGGRFYTYLKDNGVLVRHFATARCAPFVRITIGRDDDMDTLLALAAKEGK